MNSWQSATTEVEPGHRGLQAAAVVDPDPGGHLLVEVVPAVASPREAHAVPVRRAAASQAVLRTVLAPQHPVRLSLDPVHLTGAEMIAVTNVRVPAHCDLLAVAIAEGWILVQTVTVLVRVLLVGARGVMIVVAMIALVALLRVPVIPIVAKVAVVMSVPVPVTRTAQIPVVVTIVLVMTVRVLRRRVPMTGMIVVAPRVQAATVPGVPLLVEDRRIVVMTVRALPRLVRLIVAMIAHVLRPRAQVALERIATGMSVRVRLRLARGIQIDEMRGVMTDHLVQLIVHLLDARAILVRNAMIVVHDLPCVVATMATRFAILGSLTTSRLRILIAAC